MSRNRSADIAADTLKRLETGAYIAPSGLERDLSTKLEAAKSGTLFYEPHALESLNFGASGLETLLEVTPESTLEAARRVTADGSRVALLNFASAKNPGGGFLAGRRRRRRAWLARVAYTRVCSKRRTFTASTARSTICATSIA